MYSLKKIMTAILLLVSILSFSANFLNSASTASKISNSTSNNIMISDPLENNQLQDVYDSYFLVKESLVKTDSKSASLNAEKLKTAITTVKMESLKMEEHTIWMKLSKALLADAENISNSQDINKQRKFFKSLSKNLYDLIKVSKSSEPVYYQYCPMEDANWLSREKEIKNPYYGAKMMTCGKTIETL